MKYIIPVLLVFIVGCSKKEPLKEIGNAPIFNSMPSDSTGIQFANALVESGDMNIIEYLYYYNGGGVALGDINNDGLDDVFFTANQKPNALYLNLGNLKFKDITTSSGISISKSWSTGVTMSDVNNDGFLDIYVCRLSNYKGTKGQNELYINNGDATFTESAEQYGLNFSGFSTQASFFDYDNDGDMDMYLLNHSIHSPYSYGKSSLRNSTDGLAGDILFENKVNEKENRFVNVSQKSGIFSSALGYGLALAVSDINNDGFMDIYVGNDFHENDYLYINNGDKTFTESSEKYFNHTARFTMGVDIADIDNNGGLDIFTLDMMPDNAETFLKSGGEDSDKVNAIKQTFGYQQQYARNHMQLNTNNRFTEAALLSETHATDWSWSPLINDFNNDGLNDIYITNGIYKRPNDLDYVNYLSTVDFANYTATKQDELEHKLISTMPMQSIENILFINNGNLEFSKTTMPTIKSTYSNGAAYSDLDLDGDLDIIVNNINEKASILENTSNKTTQNNYIGLTLEETKNGKNTIGAKVYLYAGDKQFYKEQISVKGFLSSSTHQVHFGLGTLKNIDSLQVIWKDGTATTKINVDINAYHTIVKEVTKPHKTKVNKAISIDEFQYTHKENSFLDYEVEALIPEKLSTEGPSSVHADFNNDGLKDLFIGGGRDQAAQLFIANSKGNYSKRSIPVFLSDKKYEDVDALAFDIDNDNDLDIYALSGGNDFKEGDPKLEDRVYINDGNGNFERLQSNLLKFNGGSVSSADYNKDGFPDLFIGNRSIPGAYGLSPYSFILKNTGQNTFEIVSKKRYGMITDSQWADLNNDGLFELTLVGDWMPITILSETEEGTFIDKTADYGFGKTHGMWNCITISDIDKDGFLDIIAGNTGQNFKWKASPEKPVTLFVGDFDTNNQVDPIIFYDFFGEQIPFNSKDKLVAQIPALKKKFTNYESFSKVRSFNDLFENSTNKLLEKKQVYELRSMLYLNKDFKFQPIALPKEAQFSTIEDIAVGPSNTSLLITGNFNGFVNELGECSGSSGLKLSNLKKGVFKTIKSLDLPKHVMGRKIIPISNHKILVLSNNGKSYIINNTTQ